MTDLIPRDAAISPEVMRVWTAANIHHADEAGFLDAVAAIREAALKEARGKLHDIMCLPDFASVAVARQWASEVYALIGEKK